MDTDFSRSNIGHRSLAFYFAKILGGHFAFIRQDSAECRQQETGKSESYWHAVRILALIIWGRMLSHGKYSGTPVTYYMLYVLFNQVLKGKKKNISKRKKVTYLCNF